ncbi:MAG: hypothetical protein FWE82_04000 [Defluviitaleaceae bacterium]|nr:hypothetical protein [Defluviitaleaceae bacterium]
MELLYKPDWEKTKERLLAWWEGEITDRCVIGVTAKKNDAPHSEWPKVPEKTEDRWFDYEYIKNVNEHVMRRTFYGGESLPIWNAGYPGWGMLQTYLGTPIKLAEDTGWHFPILADGNLTDYDYNDYTLDPDNEWWKFSRDTIRFAVSEARGKSLPGLQDLGYSGDSLASMRGNENLLRDLIDCPEYVREFDMHLVKIFTQVYAALYEIIREGAEGSTSWFDLWYPGKFYPTQNDFSYMVSPAMFEDIFIPSIEAQASFLDRTVYHVDGVPAFAHVPAICELPRIQALQILPGAGGRNPLYYMDTLKYVQAKGKNLHIGIPPGDVETALTELSAKGLYIATWAGSEDEARQIIKTAEKYTRE